jgi:peptidoglycan/xylan/chitin deacetylase (PgdA/CDA1 family)
MIGTARRFGSALQRQVRAGQSRLLGSLVRVRTNTPTLALTFDDGPDPVYTPRLLDVLARHNAKATFFMIGERAAAHPDVVQAVAAGGHTVANHTWDHPRFVELTAGERRRQLRKCAAATAPFGQPFFRPPHTMQSVASFLTARRLGYEVVAWSAQVEDWRDGDADGMTKRLLERAGPGSIVVLHDALWNPGPEGVADRSGAVAAVDAFLTRLSPTHKFLTVPALMREGRPVRRPWFVRHDVDWARLRR